MFKSASTRNRILLHLLFWLMYWVFISFSQGLYNLDFLHSALYNLSLLPLTIITTYLFVYKLLPLFFKEKYLIFATTTLTLLAITVLLKRVSLLYIQYPLFYADTDWSFTFFNWHRAVGHLLQLCATLGVFTAIKLYFDWKRANNKLDILQTEKRALELSFLKAQTNPHFLFNTLNSIYYEIVNKTGQAAESVIQLSELLRLTLYESKDDFITIAQEIQMINNYIELQKRRYKNRLDIKFQISGDLNILIPPLISFSIVENTFKHGMSESVGNCKIEVYIKVNDKQYSLEVKNPATKQIDQQSEKPKGLGLENVNRQLALIYEDNYQLSNTLEEDIYICRMTLPITKS